jgi:hypothetical protein
MKNFEIGEEITWTVGREDKPIVNRGIFYDKIDEVYSEVVLVEVNSVPTSRKIQVETNLLERVDEQETV